MIDEKFNKRFLFIYINVKGAFSGQAIAAELVCEYFTSRGDQVDRILLPHLNRKSADGWKRYLLFMTRLFRAYWSIFNGPRRQYSGVCLAMGQTKFSLIRDLLALSLVLTKFKASTARKVITLNGNVFSRWSCRSLETYLLRLAVSMVDSLTCVGPKQRKTLITLGVPEGKVDVVFNTCEYHLVCKEILDAKFRDSDIVNLLMLSTLYDSKGYVEYIEAVYYLSTRDLKKRVNVKLCGVVVISEYDSRFATVSEATTWINKMGMRINSSKQVSFEWVKGSFGAEKKSLYEAADIFVFPTRYAVEAQPLVVLEAMAHGCAIVTSDVGELSSTVDNSCGIVLKNPDSESVANAIWKLILDHDLRVSLGQGSLERFSEKFTSERHFSNWNTLFSSNRTDHDSSK